MDSNKRKKSPARRLIEKVEALRKEVNGAIDPATRTKYAQFMTPSPISVFMASLFQTKKEVIHLLDPGAGIGSLSTCFVSRMLKRKTPPVEIRITAYEIDAFLCSCLHRMFDMCRQACEEIGVDFVSEIRQENFIESCSHQGSGRYTDKPMEEYDCVILNPPYGKINSNSITRRQLRKVGIETTNLYTAFLALSARHLSPGGELVSITPRSFCNGPYFLPFRKYFLGEMAFKRIHEFEARDKAFKDDSVLQENIIIHAIKTAEYPKKVTVSISHKPKEKIFRRYLPYARVVNPTDGNLIISLIHNAEGENAKQLISRLPATLEDLGITVSTGRVVDFRAPDYLRDNPEKETVPLIYPTHFHRGRISWPAEHSRKPNAIISNNMSRELLVPNGIYVLVKRFTAKEEKKRVVAALYEGQDGHDFVGFENHLNYYHLRGAGLTSDIATGLCIFLNSTTVDTFFRLFSGHTQVNATDLRNFRYPSIKQLKFLGRNAIKILNNQQMIDRKVSRVLEE